MSSVVPTWVVLLFCTLGCYASHSGSTEPLDSGPVDAPLSRPDTASPFDTSPDRSLSDVGAGECRLVLVSETEVPWPSVNCGTARSPQVVALDGPNGPFELHVAEFRSCRDRPPWILAHRLEIEPLLTYDAEQQLRPGFEIRSASARQRSALCEGNQLMTRRVGTQEEFTIGTSSPGPCTVCRGVAFDGIGWVLAQTLSDCDETSHQLTRTSLEGRTRGVFESPGELHSTIATPEGVAALSLSLSGTTQLISWPREAAQPSVIDLALRQPNFGLIALTRWPFANAAFVVAITDIGSIQWVLLNDQGEQVGTFEFPLEEHPTFAHNSLSLAHTDFGVVAVLGESWTGGAVRARSSLVAIGRDGRAVGTFFGEAIEGSLELSVAARGPFVVVHRTDETQNSHVRLFRCE